MKNLLIVDDEVDMLPLYEIKFEEEISKGELKIYFAASSAEALSMLASFPKRAFVLILSDINMPEMDGYQLLSIIKEKYPYNRVIMVSGYDR
ncbi:MAG: response regulator, partial [Oligoflexia bacterium]|nr:response regulator [Oligoflexia bacterium]